MKRTQLLSQLERDCPPDNSSRPKHCLTSQNRLARRHSKAEAGTQVGDNVVLRARAKSDQEVTLPSWRRPPGRLTPMARVPAPAGRGESTRFGSRGRGRSARAEARTAEARERLHGCVCSLVRGQAGCRRRRHRLRSMTDNVDLEITAGKAPSPGSCPSSSVPGLKEIGLAAAFVVVGASLGGSVFMGWSTALLCGNSTAPRSSPRPHVRGSRD